MWAEGSLAHAIDTIDETLGLAWRYIGIASGYLTGLLTVCGDIGEALVAAREAVPLCREDEYIDRLFPHLALCVAKACREDDAAPLWGYAGRVAGGAAEQYRCSEFLEIEVVP